MDYKFNIDSDPMSILEALSCAYTESHNSWKWHMYMWSDCYVYELYINSMPVRPCRCIVSFSYLVDSLATISLYFHPDTVQFLMYHEMTPDDFLGYL